MEKLEPRAHECPICCRKFFPTGEWVYKETQNGKPIIYCRWTCYREGMRRNEIARKVEHNRRIIEKARAMG